MYSQNTPNTVKTRYVDGTPTSEVYLVHPPTHHGHTIHEWMTHILFVPCQSAAPFLRYSNFRLWPRNSKVKVMGVVKGAMSYSWPSIISTHFLFISHQSDQQFLRYSYFEIWPSYIQGQCHEWGQRSRSHIIPSIEPMRFLFVSHESDQPFLRYGQNSVWPWKTHPKIWRKFAKITVFNKTTPKSNNHY